MKKALTDLALLTVITATLVGLGHALPAPSLAAGDVERPSLLVNPNASDKGTAKTIQEGIDMVAPGGKVLVVPGTYMEHIVIDKGLTLEAIGGKSGPVVVAPAGAPAIAVEIATADPVVIRGLTVQFSGTAGIAGVGAVDVTVERATVLAVNPPLGVSDLIGVANHDPTSSRARLVVRESFLDGDVPFVNAPSPPFPQTFGIRVQGDVDSVLEGNVIRGTGGACIFVVMRNDLGGEVNANILNNDLDECYPLGRAATILVGPTGGRAPSATQPITATGVVNIVGNTIRNSFASCLPTTAIAYGFYSGRIERNRILGVVQPCAIELPARGPAAIVVGDRRPFFTPATPTVRFNDIVGNAHAGLRVGPHQTTPLDARCNWWGSASGPSGAGPGTGDAVVADPGAATPVFMPFATEPIAESDATSC